METFKYKAEIQELKSLVEKRFGHRLCTTNDFERLSALLLTEIKTPISTSTLKRIWQYVNDEHAPRMSTLDILARYVGHADFVAFCRWRKEGAGQSSAFFSAERIVAADLSIGDEVEIGWAPNRLVRLCHKGEGIFEVVSVHESKLIDFGLADGDEYEVLKGPAGTLRYMAPEAMRNDGHPDLRADLYSLGVILGELASRIGDRRMHDVARRCMAHKPEERYASATGVMAALRMPEPQVPFVRRAFTVPIAASVVLAGLIGWFLYGRYFSEPAQDSYSPENSKREGKADTLTTDTVTYPLCGLRAIRPLGYREDSLKYSRQYEELLGQKMPAGLTHRQMKEWTTVYARQVKELAAVLDSLNSTVRWERTDGAD